MKKLLKIMLIFYLLINLYSGNIEEILKSANLFLDMLEYDTAIQYYKEALQKAPGIIDVRKNIAYAYFKIGWSEKAVKFLKEELTLFPDNGDAYDLLVFILAKSNKIEEAYNLFERYNIKKESAVKTQNLGLGDFLIGLHLHENKRYSEEEKYFRRAIERGFKPVQCIIKLLERELMREDLFSRDAQIGQRRIITKALQLYNDQPEVHYMLGVLYKKLSAKEADFMYRSIGHFERAVRLRSNFKEALFNLGAINYNLNNFGKAAEYFKKILEILPEDSEIGFLFNCSLHKSNKTVALPESSLIKCPKKIDLKETLEEKVEIEYRYQFHNDIPFILQNINFLALTYIRNGNLNKAIEKLHNGIKVWEESPEINYNLGMVYFLLNNLKEAEKYAIRATKIEFPPKERPQGVFSIKSTPLKIWDFNMALKKGNNFLEAYDLLGNIYFKLKDFDKSVKAFNKVIGIDSRDSLGYYNLGCAYFAMKKYDEAERCWKDAIRYDRRKKERGEEAEEERGEMPRVSVTVLKRTVSFHSYKSLGSLYSEKGEIEKAIESYRKAIEIFPTDADCYYELGKLYIQRGEKKEAIKCLEKYLEYGTEKEKEVKELLRELRRDVK